MKSRIGVFAAEKAIRESRRITQMTIARETGVSRGVVSGLYNGFESVRMDSLLAICSYFGCSVDELLGIPCDANKHHGQTTGGIPAP